MRPILPGTATTIEPGAAAQKDNYQYSGDGARGKTSAPPGRLSIHRTAGLRATGQKKLRLTDLPSGDRGLQGGRSRRVEKSR